MLIPSHLKIHLANGAVDMRKSSQTLAVLVKNFLEQNPLCGHLFVFYNKRKDIVKVLYWQTNGFCLWQKKLEEGKFILPSSFPSPSLEINSYHLQAFIQGLNCWKMGEAKELTYQYIS
jgi:transposase